MTLQPKTPSLLTAGSKANNLDKYKTIAREATWWKIEDEEGYPTADDTRTVLEHITGRARTGAQKGAENEVMQSGVFVDHIHEVLDGKDGMSYSEGSAYVSYRLGLKGNDDFKIQCHSSEVITVEWKKPSTLRPLQHWSHIAAQVLGPLAQLLDVPLTTESISLVGNGIDWRVIAQTKEGIKWAGPYKSYSSELVRMLVFITTRAKKQWEVAEQAREDGETSQDDEGDDGDEGDGGDESDEGGGGGGGVDEDAGEDDDDKDENQKHRGGKENPDQRATQGGAGKSTKQSKENRGGSGHQLDIFRLPLHALRQTLGSEEPNWRKLQRFRGLR